MNAYFPFKELSKCSLIIVDLLFSLGSQSSEAMDDNSPDLLVVNAKITTFDGRVYAGFAVKDGRFSSLSNDVNALLETRSSDTLVIDAQDRRVVPGLTDSHLHVVRGGRFYNLETRWEGVTSLQEALQMIRDQAQRIPQGQWVRVIGGWSPYQFQEKRMPTPEELNQIAPNTPVFVLHLYSGGILNKKAMSLLGIDKNTIAPKGSHYERDANGVPTGVLVADPNPMILYQTIARLPPLSQHEQQNSTHQYFRKLLSLGVTSVIDAGGGGHSFPSDYKASTSLAVTGELPLRISNYLFPQTPGRELANFATWMTNYKQNQNLHLHLHSGYVIEGGGELLVWKASDYENFMAKRPELHKDAEKELENVVRLHLLKKWPFRIHATYDESIERFLTLFEQINETQSLDQVRWFIDHAETVSDRNLKRIKSLGGAVAIQGRMAFAGEDFVARYGTEQAKRSPPIKKMLEMGIPVGLGTDGTRVSSFNPWATYYWAVSGRTVGGMVLYDKQDRLDRLKALELFTSGSAYFSGEEKIKGRIQVGMLADFSLLNHDILNVPEIELLMTESLMTVVGGEIKYANRSIFPSLAQPRLPAIPEWSPVNSAPVR